MLLQSQTASKARTMEKDDFSYFFLLLLLATGYMHFYPKGSNVLFPGALPLACAGVGGYILLQHPSCIINGQVFLIYHYIYIHYMMHTINSHYITISTISTISTILTILTVLAILYNHIHHINHIDHINHINHIDHINHINHSFFTMNIH